MDQRKKYINYDCHCILILIFTIQQIGHCLQVTIVVCIATPMIFGLPPLPADSAAYVSFGSGLREPSRSASAGVLSPLRMQSNEINDLELF